MGCLENLFHIEMFYFLKSVLFAATLRAKTAPVAVAAAAAAASCDSWTASVPSDLTTGFWGKGCSAKVTFLSTTLLQARTENRQNHPGSAVTSGCITFSGSDCDPRVSSNWASSCCHPKR